MRTWLVASVFAIDLLTALSPLRADTAADSFSAADLNTICSSGDSKVCAAYIAGFSRGFYYAAVSSKAGYAPCLPRALPLEQARLVVTSYMGTHTEMLQQGAPSVVALALIDAFPCRTTH